MVWDSILETPGWGPPLRAGADGEAAPALSVFLLQRVLIGSLFYNFKGA
jgi:hypothetical protein